MKYKILLERDGYKKLLDIDIELVDETVIDKISYDVLNRLKEAVEIPLEALQKDKA